MCDKVKIQELDDDTQELLSGIFKGTTYARFGDRGHLLPANYKDDADSRRNMAVRPDDVWLSSFPRSGTHWTLELLCLLMNDLDFAAALETPLQRKHIYLDVKQLYDQENLHLVTAYHDAMLSGPAPRLIRSHLPLSLLPRQLLDTAKVVYIARDPRDVAVSYYYLYRLLWSYTGDFKTYWKLFLDDLVRWSPYFPHVKEAWAQRHHPNLLFIFYEHMKEDLPSSIRRVAKFLNKEVTDEQMVKLCEHLDIEIFRKNKSVIPPWPGNVNRNGESFVRKGRSGGWREYFDEEMTAQAQRWMDENLAGSELRYPGPGHTV